MSERDAYKSVLGGKLGLKTSKLFEKRKGKKRKKELAAKESEATTAVATDAAGASDEVEVNDSGLTPAQKRHRRKVKERESAKLRELVKKTHREKVEEFNHKLSTLTEHNDLPRVSAAGNG